MELDNFSSAAKYLATDNNVSCVWMVVIDPLGNMNTESELLIKVGEQIHRKVGSVVGDWVSHSTTWRLFVDSKYLQQTSHSQFRLTGGHQGIHR